MKETILKIIKQHSSNLETIQSLTNFELNDITKIIDELISERIIFLNTAKKYELIKTDYLIGTLEKTSKGSCYVNVNGERISVPSNELYTALKNDIVVVEKQYGNHGIMN